MTREETIATLKANYPDACFEQLRDAVDTAISVLKQPEIIRCGDCKYFKVDHGWNCASYPICEVSPQRIIMPDDYCSFAERRTDG